MPELRRYATATAFRAALETRLRQQAGGGQASLGRLRRRVAFERLLARLFAEEASPWLLKGGYALELRLGDTARATRDLDLGVPDPARLVVGDGVAGAPERLAGHDFLGFAGIPPAQFAVLPAAQHFAEKVHAYTFPWRDRPNTRVRDLVDLVLLIDTGLLESAATVAALQLTFARRATHPLPGELPPPPAGWATPFAALAAEVALAERTVDAAFARVSAFFAALPLRDE